MTERPILIAGPTASGKSALALRLAQETDGLIVNADALQVYDCWRVLTARPDDADLARADHALYGHVSWRDSYSVGAWLRDAMRLAATGRRLIFVGGTGLYFMALTQGLAPVPPIPAPVRAEGDALRAGGGAAAFRDYLARHDPVLLARMDRDNTARLQRAWEVHRATGRPLSDWQAGTGPAPIPEDAAIKVFFTSDPEWLRERIDARFDAMIAQGALDECRAMRDDWTPSLPSARALGAPDLMAALAGEIPLDLAIARAKIATHRYAKRQRTWFRGRMADWLALRSEELGSENLAHGLDAAARQVLRAT